MTSYFEERQREVKPQQPWERREMEHIGPGLSTMGDGPSASCIVHILKSKNRVDSKSFCHVSRSCKPGWCLLLQSTMSYLGKKELSHLLGSDGDGNQLFFNTWGATWPYGPLGRLTMLLSIVGICQAGLSILLHGLSLGTYLLVNDVLLGSEKHCNL